MARVRRTLVPLAGLALLAAQTALPGLAMAKEALPVWACGADGGGVSARGGFPDSRGTIREKDTGQVVNDMPASAKGKAPAAMTISVPVFFHVITSGAAGNLTDTQLQAQVTQLNEAYGGSYGGPDTGFSFALAGVDRTDNATWYASKGGGAEHAMKTALKTGGDNTMNVYTTSGGGYLGYAYLPDITNTAQAYLDGVVIDWKTVPGASTEYAGLYDEGDTLVHESGHWLNLEHTFYRGCNGRGDYVDDTPYEATPTSGCPAGKDTCTAPGLDPIHNYMDYSYDQCYTEFTAGQAARMQDAWLTFRAP